MRDNAKNFQKWMRLKENIHNKNNRRSIKEGQIWWISVGENVGVEINGKSDKFSRPVIIYKKLSNMGFMGIPLTSQYHDGSWYVSFEFNNKQEYAALSQARTFSVARLCDGKCMGELSESDFSKVRLGFSKLYS
ncbi:MAG: type II toxin-antitoxin system PemK/MazF family toxin [Candidatus Saccharibacteria bacterium]|nr:type II toxin-antitoxin system PemK/MazF family toxin [Candidatus Saccharibacteria bacterium]